LRLFSWFLKQRWRWTAQHSSAAGLIGQSDLLPLHNGFHQAISLELSQPPTGDV